jgi:hypothetical protein
MIKPRQVDDAQELINTTLLPLARSRFRLNGGSTDNWAHGVPHWYSVWVNALTLASLTTKEHDLNAIAVFAICHDMERLHDGQDQYHGQRAADHLSTLDTDGWCETPIDRVLDTISLHSTGVIMEDRDAQIMLDADRLDLDRFGINLREGLLHTPHAKSLAVGGPGVWDMFHRIRTRITQEHHMFDVMEAA